MRKKIARSSRRTILSFLEKSARMYPKKAFVIKDEAIVSYRELAERCAVMAGRLNDNSIRQGDRVGIFLDKSPEEVIGIFGIVKAGATFVSINPRLKRDQILHILRDCGVKGIITSQPLYDSFLQGALADTAVKFIIFADKNSHAAMPCRGGARAVTPPAKDIGCIIYTSGSTGRPKGVVIPHKNLIDGADIVSRYLRCKHNDRVLSLLPFSFDYGLNQLLTTVRNGATIVLKDFVFPRDTLKAVEKHSITGLAGIPTIWVSLLNVPDIGNYDLSSLRYVTNSGGKIPVEYVERMIKIFHGTKIYLMYGLTEAFRSTYLPPSLVAKKPDSIGKAIPRVMISVLNKEGKECKSGEEGELVHRGALISLGYWGNREATDARIRSLPGGARRKRKGEMGVFSGDVIKKDRQGYLYFIGRRDEMIKSSGYRISPTEIEEAVYKIPGVVGVVAFGKEDARLGEKITIVVNVAAGKAVTAESIGGHCAQHLPDYALPHEIILTDQMPKTSSGKLDRSLIKEQHGGHR